MSWNNNQNYNNQGYGYPSQQRPGHGNNGYNNGNSPEVSPVYASHGPDSRSSPPQFGFAILGSGTSNPPVIFGNHGHTGTDDTREITGVTVMVEIDGVRFCGYCGARKPQNYCTNCGNKVGKFIYKTPEKAPTSLKKN